MYINPWHGVSLVGIGLSAVSVSFLNLIFKAIGTTMIAQSTYYSMPFGEAVCHVNSISGG
jgi:hypothetical protein